jgi:tetratricopeptide (TPR) repeat protein
MTAQQTKDRVISKKSHSKAFTEGIEILAEEIELALLWNRPSILLAIHNSKTGRIEAQQSLEQRIVKKGKRVAHINVENANPDVILAMSEALNLPDVVFFVSGIENADQKSGGKVYRAFNIRRELLVEKGIRAVFWLNESEAANLPRFAPDFWSFRHRVVEFSSKHGTKKQTLPVGLFLWEEQLSWMDEDAQKNKLEYYEEFLMRLPKEEGSASAQIEAILKLAHYSWLLNDLKKFSAHLNIGFDLLKKYPIRPYQAWMLNAEGIGLYEEGNKKNASIKFAQALRHDPDNSAILMNTSIATHGLGKNSEAIQIGKRAVKKDAENLSLWRVLGYLFLSMGKIEDAIEAMTTARDINPRSVESYYSLAVCYFKNEQFDECAKELSKAEKISPPENAIQNIYVDILGRKTDDALALLKRSLEKKLISNHHILRDPNLNFLLNLQEFMVSG